MKYKVGRTLLGLLFVMMLILSACAQPAPEATEAPAEEAEAEAPEEEASEEPILIGWSCPRSGNHAILGEWEERAVVMAFDEKNAEGGINGRPLVLVKEDDEADPTKAVNIAEKLCTEDKVVAVGGFPNSTPALAALPVYTEHQVVQVVTGLNDTITQQGSEYVFRNSARGSDFERVIVEYLLDQGYTKFASMADNSAYGQGLCEYERTALEKAGLDLVVENYAGDDKDFTGQLTRILQDDPDVILLAGSEVAAGLIAKQARALGFEGILAGGCAIGTPKFIEVAGDAAEGAFFSSVYISPGGDPMIEDWAKRYEEKWGEPPEGHGAKAYDGAMLLIEAIENAYPEVTGERISEEFHKICGYKGVQGEFCFDETGEGIDMLHIGVIQNAELLPVEEAEETAAPAAEASGEPIKIGWMGAKSGTMAMLGEWDTRGILLAFEAKNAEGGINGQPLELIQYDDEADPTKAVGLAEKLCTEDEVVAAFACTNSTPTLAVVPIFAKYKVPHITGGINAQITQEGSAYVFRDTAVGTLYEKVIVDYMVEQGYTKFAIIADNSAYGQGEADLQEAALAEHGLEALLREIYAGEDKDFTGQVTRILQADPEVLLFAGADVPSGLIAKQARGMGFEGAFAGAGSVGTPKFIEVAEDAAEGVLFSAPFVCADMNDMTQEFSDRYEEMWGEPGESHGAKAYDGAMVLIQALEAAYPEITGERIAEELHNVCGYQGLQGEFCFDETGEGLSTMNIGVIENGEVKPVE